MDNKTAILIIHGFLGNIDDNIFLEETLKKAKYDTYSFNLPGHEEYIKIKNITRNDWIDFSYNEIQKLINDKYENIILIGHSLGGVIASIIASNSEYEKYISKVVLIAPAINYYGKSYVKRLYLRRLVRNISFIFDKNKPNPENLKKRSLKAYFEFLKISKEYKDTILKITQPLLFIQGNQDKMMPIEYNKELFEKIESENKSFIEIKNGSHWLFLSDKKEETSEKILSFIKQ